MFSFNLRGKSVLLGTMLLILSLMILVACGNGNDTPGNNDKPVVEENNTESEASDNGPTEEIELPSVIPSDTPLPDDAIVAIFNDTEENGEISVNTSMALEDLETMYDDYFNGHPLSDEVKKDLYDEEGYGYDGVGYEIDSDESLFFIQIRDRDDHRSVNLQTIMK